MRLREIEHLNLRSSSDFSLQTSEDSIEKVVRFLLSKSTVPKMAVRALSVLPVSVPLAYEVSEKHSHFALSFPSTMKSDGFSSSILGSLKLKPIIITRRSSSSTVFFMLPTAKPDRAYPEKIPQWSARAIKSFGMGELEARKLKFPTTGTEALLMGILVEGTNIAAKFLRANGITLFKVRDEIIKLLGKSDMYFFSPEHPPLTEPAQRALDWAVDEKLKSGESVEVTTTHLLLGIWAEEESAGHKILALLGFDNEKASELAKSANVDYIMSYR